MEFDPFWLESSQYRRALSCFGSKGSGARISPLRPMISRVLASTRLAKKQAATHKQAVGPCESFPGRCVVPHHWGSHPAGSTRLCSPLPPRAASHTVELRGPGWVLIDSSGRETSIRPRSGVAHQTNTRTARRRQPLTPCTPGGQGYLVCCERFKGGYQPPKKPRRHQNR